VEKRTRKAEQSERTKAALIAAGRAMFAADGYAAVAAEDVARTAGVTTGAVYHQFGSKRGLFLGVFEAVEAEVTERVMAAAGSEGEPWAQFLAACDSFLDASADADVRQVLLIDGRAVLGWEEWHSVMARYGLGLTRTVLGALMDGGLLPVLPVESLATLLFGALNEAALYIATSPEPAVARQETMMAMRFLLESLAARK
jgi:AcrR family transcriptional regulator